MFRRQLMFEVDWWPGYEHFCKSEKKRSPQTLFMLATFQGHQEMSKPTEHMAREISGSSPCFL